MLGALAAALVAAQGQAVQLEYAGEAGLASVHIVWNKRQIPFAQSEDRLTLSSTRSRCKILQVNTGKHAG